jgi:hypothetical protein
MIDKLRSTLKRPLLSWNHSSALLTRPPHDLAAARRAATARNARHLPDDSLSPSSLAWRAVQQRRPAEGAGGPSGEPPAGHSAEHMLTRIGQLIWMHRRDLREERVLHFEARGSLLGVLDAPTHQVFVRTTVFDAFAQSGTPLDKITAAVRPPSAGALPRGQHFKAHAMHDLLWLFGQNDPSATQVVPGRVATDALHLRRMPGVTPALLAPRHWALIRVMLGGPLVLSSLQTRLQAEVGAPCDGLAADLASLYLTDSLRLVQAA